LRFVPHARRSSAQREQLCENVQVGGRWVGARRRVRHRSEGLSCDTFWHDGITRSVDACVSCRVVCGRSCELLRKSGNTDRRKPGRKVLLAIMDLPSIRDGQLHTEEPSGCKVWGPAINGQTFGVWEVGQSRLRIDHVCSRPSSSSPNRCGAYWPGALCV